MYTGSTTISASVIAGGSIGGSIVGCLVLCCCFWFCYCLLKLGSKSGRSHSSSVPPPRTVVIPNTTSPRSTAPPSHAAVFMAAKEEVFVVKAEEQSYPQAQTYVGEAPPDYNSAMNYPKANICQWTLNWRTHSLILALYCISYWSMVWHLIFISLILK